MQRLLQFLYRYRAFLLFLFLEVISFWLIVDNNSYQGARYFNSSNTLVASVSETSQGVSDFFDLTNQNKALTEENGRLRTLLKNFPDTILNRISNDLEMDSSDWQFMPAKVINKSLFLQKNYLTINKGTKDGIEKGMGVLGTEGVAGQVVAVSEDFSSVASLLHSSYLVSSTHGPSGSLCTTTWDGEDPLYAKLQFLPRHLSLLQGDSIFTSGYNTRYPPGTIIGIINDVTIAEDATFYDVTIRLSTDFYRLSYVYVVKYNMRAQKDSLEGVLE